MSEERLPGVLQRLVAGGDRVVPERRPGDAPTTMSRQVPAPPEASPPQLQPSRTHCNNAPLPELSGTINDLDKAHLGYAAPTRRGVQKQETEKKTERPHSRSLFMQQVGRSDLEWQSEPSTPLGSWSAKCYILVVETREPASASCRSPNV